MRKSEWQISFIRYKCELKCFNFFPRIFFFHTAHLLTSPKAPLPTTFKESKSSFPILERLSLRNSVSFFARWLLDSFFYEQENTSLSVNNRYLHVFIPWSIRASKDTTILGYWVRLHKTTKIELRWCFFSVLFVLKVFLLLLCFLISYSAFPDPPPEKMMVKESESMGRTRKREKKRGGLEREHGLKKSGIPAYVL